MTGQPFVSIIVCAHNEDKYITACLKSVYTMLKNHNDIPHEIVLIADRCTDKTVEKALCFPNVHIIKKSNRKYLNGYAEALNVGLNCAKGNLVLIVDADMILPLNFLSQVLPKFTSNKIVCISCPSIIRPSNFWNRFSFALKRLYVYDREVKGGCRIFRKSIVSNLGGFRDVWGTDTDLDFRLIEKGFLSIRCDLNIQHIRESTLKSIIQEQVRMGKARKMLGYGLPKILAHSLVRLRPFVIVGYLATHLRTNS